MIPEHRYEQLISCYSTESFLTLVLALATQRLLIALAAAIAGSQLSPISIASIVSSASARSYVADHNKTMISYSIGPLIGSLIGCIIIGFGHSLGYGTLLVIALPISFITTVLYPLWRHISNRTGVGAGGRPYQDNSCAREQDVVLHLLSNRLY